MVNLLMSYRVLAEIHLIPFTNLHHFLFPRGYANAAISTGTTHKTVSRIPNEEACSTCMRTTPNKIMPDITNSFIGSFYVVDPPQKWC